MKKNIYSIVKVSVATSLLLLTGCTREIDTTTLAGYPVTADVFIDKFTADLGYSAWGKVTNFDVDTETKYNGTASMRIEVPEPDDPMGNWAGGNFYSTVGRDLSQYNALTFYVKSSLPSTITVGLGDSDDGKYRVTLSEVETNSNWRKVIVPIPNSSKLTSETGLFYYSAGAVENRGYTVWFDEVKFEKLGTLAHQRIENVELAGFPGSMEIGMLTEIVNLPDGTDQRMQVSPHYFTYESSDSEVVTVDGNILSVHKGGTAVISIKEVAGEIKVNGVDFASDPQHDESNVISVFCDKYNNQVTANWNPGWEYSTAEYMEINAVGNRIAHYTNLNFVGIVFNSQIDCSDVNYMHLDVMTLEDVESDTELKVEIHNMPSGGASSVTSYTVKKSTHEGFRTGEWLSLDIPIESLSARKNIAQLVLSTLNLTDIYVDNIYFYSGESGGVSQPATAAPLPLHPAEDVISLYSDSYNNEPVGTWSADWDMADVYDVLIEENNTKQYFISSFAGIDFSTDVIDLSGMTHIHIDLWLPQILSEKINIKLVDFGDDGVYGGDDVEHELSLPVLVPGKWNSIDIPLSEFTNLVSKKHLAQILIIGNAGTVYMDNLYFYNSDGKAVNI